MCQSALHGQRGSGCGDGRGGRVFRGCQLQKCTHGPGHLREPPFLQDMEGETQLRLRPDTNTHTHTNTHTYRHTEIHTYKTERMEKQKGKTKKGCVNE